MYFHGFYPILFITQGSASDKGTEMNCNTNVDEKVFFREKFEGQDLILSMSEPNLRENVDFKIMVQHLPETVEVEEVKRYVNDSVRIT